MIVNIDKNKSPIEISRDLMSETVYFLGLSFFCFPVFHSPTSNLYPIPQTVLIVFTFVTHLASQLLNMGINGSGNLRIIIIPYRVEDLFPGKGNASFSRK